MKRMKILKEGQIIVGPNGELTIKGFHVKYGTSGDLCEEAVRRVVLAAKKAITQRYSVSS